MHLPCLAKQLCGGCQRKILYEEAEYIESKPGLCVVPKRNQIDPIRVSRSERFVAKNEIKY